MRVHFLRFVLETLVALGVVGHWSEFTLPIVLHLEYFRKHSVIPLRLIR